jgi:photosystem II stability/assembly factor-like uncharacterized protein
MKSLARSFALLLLSALPTAAQPTNVPVSAPGAASPNEITVAINPTDQRHVAAGSNVRYFYRSTDGGMSWVQSLLPPGTFGDPSIAYDANGNLYYAHLMSGLLRLGVHRSTDNGITWYDSVTIGYNPPKNQDKEWIAVDRTNSAYRNRLYLAWTEFDQYGSTNPADSTRILFSWSSNAGTTWSTPVRLSDQAGDCLDLDSTVEGAVPAVGPEGQVYMSWAGPLGIVFDRSTDGGATFGANIPVTSIPGGWDFAVPGIYRCNGLPETACDVSNSPYRGTVYILWSDQRNGLDNTDVFLVRSTDHGTTWSTVKRVNADITSRHQFYPWLSVDPLTGYLYVVYYDRAETAGDATDIALAKSTDGGTTFSSVKVSASSFVPQANVFFGDYLGMDAVNRSVVPVWMRMDNAILSVWSAPIADVPLSTDPEHGQPGDFILEQNYPNPFNPSTTIAYTLPHAGFVTLRVLDPLGREVALLENGLRSSGRHTVVFEAARLSSGIYIAQLRLGGVALAKPMMLVR